MLNFLSFTEKIIKLNFDVDETLKTCIQVLETPIHLKPIDQRNEENLLDLNTSLMSGMYSDNITHFLDFFFCNSY